jgi:hypothetical protein
VNTSNNAAQLNQLTQRKNIMKNAATNITKDNIAAALVLAAIAVAIITAVFNFNRAPADAPMPIIRMETIVVAAQRDAVVKLDTIVVTAPRNAVA